MSKVNSNRNKISRNTIWYLVAGLGGHAYLLISLPLIQGALLPSEFGSFMILSQVTIILQMAISGLFSGAIIRLRVEYSEIEQRYFIFTVILSAVALQAAIWAILAWLGEPLLIAFYPNLTPNLGVLPTLLGAWNLILTVRTLVTTFLKSQEAPKRLLTLNLCYGITLLASLWVTLIAQPLEIGEPNALVRVFWAIIFAELTASFMASYFLSGHLVPKLKGNYIRVILKFTTPLALGSIMLALVFNLDIIILARYISLETLGIYAFGATLGKASAAVVTAYVSAYSPHLINRLSLRSIAETSKMIEKIMADNLVFLGVITGVVILCAEAIIAIMLSPPSQTEINVMSSPGLAVWSLVAICIGNLSRSVFLVFYNTIFMLKRTWLLLLLNSLLLATTAIIMFVGANFFGVVGVALSYAISYAILSAIAALPARRKFTWAFPWSLALRTVFAASVGLAGAAAIWQFGWSMNDAGFWTVKVIQALVYLSWLPYLIELWRAFSKNRVEKT